MTTDLLHRQIRAAHQAGANCEEIAEQLNCPLPAVKLALSDSEDFSDDDAAAVARVIKTIALSGENERNRLTAACYVYDVKKGLRVPKQAAPTVTAVQINQLIHAAHQDVAQFLDSHRGAGACQEHLAPPNLGGQPGENPSSNPSAAAASADFEI